MRISKPTVTLLAIGAVIALVVACGGPSWEDPLQPHVTWVLESLNGAPILKEAPIYLTIYDTSIGGYTGCNSYGAGGRSFVPLITHPDGSYMEGEFSNYGVNQYMTGCPSDAAIDQEKDYVDALKGGRTFRIQGNRLEILDDGQNMTLRFARQPPFPGYHLDLANTEWLIEGDRYPAILAFIDDKVAVGVDSCWVDVFEYSNSNGLLGFSSGIWSALDRPCKQREVGDSYWANWGLSFWAAEHYSVIDLAGSERLMVGTRLGATFEFRTLPALKPDVEEEEWKLLEIVDYSPDGRRDFLSTRGAPVEPSSVTISFKDAAIFGFAGCNSYEASVSLVDDVVSIGSPLASELSCHHLENVDDVMEQEIRYLSLLPQVTWIGTYDRVLFMSTDMGIYLLFEAE